ASHAKTPVSRGLRASAPAITTCGNAATLNRFGLAVTGQAPAAKQGFSMMKDRDQYGQGNRWSGSSRWLRAVFLNQCARNNTTLRGVYNFRTDVVTRIVKVSART